MHTSHLHSYIQLGRHSQIHHPIVDGIMNPMLLLTRASTSHPHQCLPIIHPHTHTSRYCWLNEVRPEKK